MNKIVKWFSTAICIMMCLGFVTITADAAGGNRDGEIVDGTLLTSEKSVKGTWQAMARGTLLSSGYGSIDYYGNGVIDWTGMTLCNRVCDSVVLNMYLERLVNNTWVSVDQRFVTAYNTTQATYGTSIIIPKGYYYRVQGVHTATKGSTKDSSSSWSSGIWIS